MEALFAHCWGKNTISRRPGTQEVLMMTGFMLAIVLPYRSLRVHGRTVADGRNFLVMPGPVGAVTGFGK